MRQVQIPRASATPGVLNRAGVGSAQVRNESELSISSSFSIWPVCSMQLNVSAKSLRPGLVRRGEFQSLLLALKLLQQFKFQLQRTSSWHRNSVHNAVVGPGKVKLACATAFNAAHPPRAWPNNSLKVSANSVARRPSGAGPSAHFAPAVQRTTPLSPP